jgi:hypothetical protein
MISEDLMPMQHPKMIRVISFRLTEEDWDSGSTSRRMKCENPFQLLAEDKLQSNVWRSYRDYTKGNLKTIVEQAPAECSARSQELLGTVGLAGIKR